MHALVEGGADVRAVDEQGLSALLNAVKVGRFASSFFVKVPDSSICKTLDQGRSALD